MKEDINNIIESAKEELVFRTSRSGGSGGQHVNKVETKVALRWDVVNSSALSEEHKLWVLEKLKRLINKDGILMLTSSDSRSQLKNKQDVIQKLELLLRGTFIKPKARKASKPSKKDVAKRLEGKSKKSKLKESRKKPRLDE